MNASVVKLAYKRLETDEEFRARAAAKLSGYYASRYLSTHSGEMLDEFVWDVLRMQRRIVEIFP